MATRDIYQRTFDESSDQSNNRSTCPECNADLVTEHGETSCRDCGLVVEACRVIPDEGALAGRDDNQRRTGNSLTPARHDRGLSTKIGSDTTDLNGNLLSQRKRRRLGRLRHQHSRAQSATTAERNLAQACGEIARLVSAVGGTRSLREEASQIFRRAQSTNLLLGRSIEAMAAGSVYAAFRQSGHPRPLDDVAAVARVTQDRVANAYQVLNAELAIAVQPVTPLDYLSRLTALCEVSAIIQQQAGKLASHAEDVGIANGRHPADVAAACLYVIADMQSTDTRLTQTQLADAANVSSETVRARREEIQNLIAEGDFCWPERSQQ